MSVDIGKVELAVRQLLEAVGENPDREGLRDTPARYARWWREFMDYDAGTTDTAFTSVSDDQMVIVKGMRVWSLCEHHLLPFWCDVTVGYISKSKVLGLSKFARIAHRHAHRLQVQERLVSDIAADIMRIAETDNVAVVTEGEHLCMSIRGIKTPSRMVSSALHGAFRNQREVREEFLVLSR